MGRTDLDFGKGLVPLDIENAQEGQATSNTCSPPNLDIVIRMATVVVSIRERYRFILLCLATRTVMKDDLYWPVDRSLFSK
jgi:hypothetical protein